MYSLLHIFSCLLLLFGDTFISLYKQRHFCKLDTGCNGVVFIQMRKREGDPSPKDIVHHMMTSLAVTKKHVSRLAPDLSQFLKICPAFGVTQLRAWRFFTRFLLRLLPVEVSCYTSDEEIRRAIKPVIEKYFPIETEKPRKVNMLLSYYCFFRGLSYYCFI